MPLSITPFYGGKNYLLPKIKAYVAAASPSTFVDVFGGGGHVCANIDMPPYPKGRKIYNDIDKRLVNLFRVLQTKPDELKERCKYAVASRALYEEYKEMTGNEVEDAFRVWYTLALSFGGKMKGTYGYMITSERRVGTRILTMEGWDEIIAEIKTWNIENLDFRDLIQRYDSPITFFYLDPPYYKFNDYQYNFTEQDFVDLAKILRQIKGIYLLNINDDPFIRRVFGQPTTEEVYLNVAFHTRGQPRTKRVELFYSNLGKKQFYLTDFIEIPLPKREEVAGEQSTLSAFM